MRLIPIANSAGPFCFAKAIVGNSIKIKASMRSKLGLNTKDAIMVTYILQRLLDNPQRRSKVVSR